MFLALQASTATTRLARMPAEALEPWISCTLRGRSSKSHLRLFERDLMTQGSLKEGEGLKMVAKIPKDCIFVSVNLWNR